MDKSGLPPIWYITFLITPIDVWTRSPNSTDLGIKGFK